MSIRWKLLLLLGAMALTPLLLLRFTAYDALERVGRDLAARSKTLLVSKADKELGRLVEDHALVLRRMMDLVETLLEFQAVEVENRLAGPLREGGRFFLANGGGGLPNTVEHQAFTSAAREGKAIPVSFDVVALLLPRGQAAKDVLRLAGMESPLLDLRKRMADLLMWQFVQLDSGAQLYFPAHDWESQMCIPLREPWYAAVREADGMIWSGPLLDRVTGKPVLVAAMPVHGKDGAFAGVTGIYVPVYELLHQNKQHLTFSGLRSWLLQPGQEQGVVRVLIDGAMPEHHGRHWRIPDQKELLSAQGLERVWRDMRAGENGVRLLQLDGGPHAFAYARVNDMEQYLALAVPREVILADALEAERHVRSEVGTLVDFVGWLLLSVLAAAALVAFLVSRHVMHMVNSLASTVARVAKGDFSVRARRMANDELGELADFVNAMIPSLEEQVRLKEAIAVAQGVQRRLLPRERPATPGLDIAGSSTCSEDLGGDYFDYITPDREPGRLVIAVGDVSGHGLDSALIMAGARAYLRSRALDGVPLQSAVAEANKLVTRDNYGSGNFITLLVMEIDAAGAGLAWVRAGHDPALLYTPEDGCVRELGGPVDTPLGVTPDAGYTLQQGAPFTKGSVLLLGTDGIWETMNNAGEMFGKVRLKELIARHAGDSAEEVRQAVLQALTRFRNGFVQEDDVTLVVVKALEVIADVTEELPPRHGVEGRMS